MTDSRDLRSLELGNGVPWPIHAICYGPFRDGQSPHGQSPTVDQIRADLQLMAPHWNLLRTYSAIEPTHTLLESIVQDEVDVKVMLGVWIAAAKSRDDEAAAANRRDVDAAIALAAEFPDIVVAISVGNETQVSWSAHRSSVDGLVEHVRAIRAATTVPVTSADDYQYWRQPESRTLAQELDFVTVHVHPLWNGQQLDGAMGWLAEQMAAVADVHPDRPLVIGETGWATAVAPIGEQATLIRGSVGEAEQAEFYRAARAWAEAEGITTFMFEAFDENWKGGDHPAEVEKHWGLYRADRSPKRAMQTGPR